MTLKRAFVVGYVYALGYPGTKPGCFGHARGVYSVGYPQGVYFDTARVFTRVPLECTSGENHCRLLVAQP